MDGKEREIGKMGGVNGKEKGKELKGGEEGKRKKQKKKREEKEKGGSKRKGN